MGKISTNELAAKLIERKGLTKKEASAFVNEFFFLIQKGMEEDSAVKVKGLGTFKLIDVEDRESINVNTGERVLIEGHRKISFIPDALLKELVNKPFSQFETVVLNEGVDFNDIPKDEPEIVPEVSEPEIVPEVSEPEIVPEVPEQEIVPEVPEQEVISEVSEPEVTPEVSEPDTATEEPEPQVEAEESMVPLVDFVADDVVEETTEEAPEEAIEEEMVEEESDVDEEEEPKRPWKIWILMSCLCCLFFVGGFLLGRYYQNDNQVTPTPTSVPEVVKKTVPEVKPKAEPELETKVEQTAEPQVEAEAVPQQEPKTEPKVEPKTEPKVEPKVEAKQEPQPNTLDKYEQMDIRIRTGAYRIVGTDHVEKVKAGDNLSKICKRTIGPGMECYLEAYNNIKSDDDLKQGQEIKIPKLELKKKKVKIDN